MGRRPLQIDIRLGNQTEQGVQHALETLWADPRLQLADPRTGVSRRMSGSATLPGGASVPCASLVLGFDGEYLLSFYVPVNALAIAWPQVGDFPFVGGPSKEEDQAWQAALQEWLASFGRVVFEAVPFPGALVGFDLSMDEERDRRLLEEIPQQRWEGILRRERDGLAWYPATTWGRSNVDWSRPASWRERFGLWRAIWRLRAAARR